MNIARRMSLTEAAAYMGKSERSLLRMVGSGELVGYKNGGRWNFDQPDLDAYIEAQKQKTRNKAIKVRTDLDIDTQQTESARPSNTKAK